MQTSLISFISSDHGRLRRQERDIAKRDLQKALKYGKFTRQKYKDRWKVEYDGIVFITDNDRRQEVTCYPSPLSLVPVTTATKSEHAKAAEVISRKSDVCTSHTVFVVDNSGSMRTHDIPLHRDRQTAAFSTIALEYVAEQLFNGSANNRDVVSLIEFSRNPAVVFEREPISWVLYNKILSRRDTAGFHSRNLATFFDTVFHDSNYICALECANKLLEKGNHEDCALSLFFISDGEPTDAAHKGLVPAAAIRKMEETISNIATRFDYQLNMSFVGFGGPSKDFAYLKMMADAANKAAEIPLAKFIFCGKMANSIGAAITSLAESTTLTRTSLLSGDRRTKRNTRNDIEHEDSNNWVQFPILGHFIYDPSQKKFVHYPLAPFGAIRAENTEEAKRMFRENQLPPFLTMNKGYIGTGAERVAYRCHLSDTNGEEKLGPMIAKETFRVDRIDEHIEFHKTFCESQSLAAHLALEFNKRLRALQNYSEASTPKISFLKCSVLLLEDSEWQNGKRGVLVEKQLDTTRFEWKKWNNNVGGVDGRICHRPMDVDEELAKLNAPKRLDDMEVIEEGSEEEDDSDEEEDGEDCIRKSPSEEEVHSICDFKPSDYLQAFSHFTYLFTNRKVLVCDLQGVYNTDMVPPTFELSDPAVHYRSKQGKTMVFGRTDRGQKGIQLFFNSHKCTGICKIMELSKKNKNWNKHWRRDFAKDMEQNLNVR